MTESHDNRDANQRSTGQAIQERSDAIAELVVDRIYDLQPELAARYGMRGRAFCLKDTKYHLDFLAQAISVSQPVLFADYVSWAKVMLEARGIPTKDLYVNLQQLSLTLTEVLGPKDGTRILKYIETALDALNDAPSTIPPFLDTARPLHGLAQAYLNTLLAGNRHGANRLILEAVESGTSIRELYLHVFGPTQLEIGRLWQTNQISVAQEHFCTAATQLIMSQLYPFIFTGERSDKTLLALSVGGELHELGIRMVADFFELEGWATLYLGANTPSSSILKMAREHNADVIAISVTIATQLGEAERLIKLLRSDETLNNTKIIVGGNPFKLAPELWQQLGADGTAFDAEQAVQLADELLQGPS